MTKFLGIKDGKEIESIELNLLVNTRSLSKSQIVDISNGLDESVVDDLITKFQLRSSLYFDKLYEVKNNRIISKHTWKEIPEYFLCLYYSYYGANDNSGGTELFERISAEALKNLINGEVLNLGFPSGKGFNQNLDEIAKICFEERGKPAPGSYKDDGVDVVAYKSFGDFRSSNLYVLLQCAAGIHWKSKKQIPMNRWTQYIFWVTNNIIESISTVEFVEEKEWQKHTTTYGMLIDRLRIYNFLYNSNINSQLRLETKAWSNNKINQGL